MGTRALTWLPKRGKPPTERHDGGERALDEAGAVPSLVLTRSGSEGWWKIPHSQRRAHPWQPLKGV
ncbi:conserved hypothetical protein [Nitrolancea hollandica Lb]|uniref:Uncharacterized protein n=1 Tax=Nitrolancea hollandica Lb TaxID=1129897 RepID=I4ECV0_9BACT|nr:conserved hypothetical protein [Nitrolancea hollandica Lb]